LRPRKFFRKLLTVFAKVRVVGKHKEIEEYLEWYMPKIAA
jgi:hypothetical protein